MRLLLDPVDEIEYITTSRLAEEIPEERIVVPKPALYRVHRSRPKIASVDLQRYDRGIGFDKVD